MNQRLKHYAVATSLLFAGCSSQGGQETTLPPTTTPIHLSLPPEITTIPIAAESSIVPESTSTVAQFPGVAKPDCVTEIKPGDTLFSISKNLIGVSIVDLQTENRIENPDKIRPGLLDICINEVNDITGEPRVPVTTTLPPVSETTTTVLPPPETAPPVTQTPQPLPTGVEAQQLKINELLVPLGMPKLVVDGEPGKFTDQADCTLRLLNNLPPTRQNIAPGSPEEQIIMAANGFPILNPEATKHPKWEIIDQVCQVTLLGSGTHLDFILPSSSGMADFPSKNGTFKAFRFIPGLHNSTLFPVDPASQREGNMLDPVYHYRGQATHGALSVPTYPASHGCNRLSEANQAIYINWLGLSGIDEEIRDNDFKSIVDLTVIVEGEYEYSIAA